MLAHFGHLTFPDAPSGIFRRVVHLGQATMGTGQSSDLVTSRVTHDPEHQSCVNGVVPKSIWVMQ